MAKLLLLSIIFLTVIIPARASRAHSPVQGLKRALAASVALFVLYLVAVRFVVTRIAF